MLSKWYGDRTLSSAEAEQVQTLLNQLAGTVLYSTQNCLEPPYTVRAGDTLESIAQQCNVPWQLLAKINGIPASNQIQPGQQLKVIHGPFAATIDVGRNQLTLLVDGRYAGRFPVTIDPGVAVSEGTWMLDQKLSAPSGTPTPPSSIYAVGPTVVDHELVLARRNGLAAVDRVTIVSGLMSSPSAPAMISGPTIHMAPGDADEVADILSVGSQVTIKK
jgi:LysM repeat protein